jgi:uncharacterized protein YpbB
MGKKKSEQFGEELLEIIISYCESENIEPEEITIAEQVASKKNKGDSKKISFRLFNEGKAIAEIAKEREMAESTIEGHLAFYVGTGEIPVNKFVSQEMMVLIVSHFNGSDDLSMGQVKEALGEKVSWRDLRFVVNHLKFLRKTGQNM